MDGVKLLSSEQNSVVVGFYGKISSNNSQAVDEELAKLRSDNPQGSLVFDFEKLEYISSAGLRALLKASKNEHNQKIKIINVSLEVYEILEMTGFNQMFEVHKVMRRFFMEGLELIGGGTNGEVYRVDKENIIKLFKEDTSFEVIDRERNLAKQALIEGIPTAISFDVVQVEERYGIMFELIDADSLSTTLKNKPKEYDSYVDKYIDLIKKIHSIKGDSDKFINIKSVYYDAIDYSKDYYTKEELLKLRNLVDSVPDTGTLIHGDYHPNNIMVQDGELILIDMGDMTLGHPMFDFLATAATQVNLVNLNPEYAEFHTKMPADLITKTWRRLIDGYFEDKSEEERKRIEEQICIFSKLKVALCPYFGRGVTPEILQASIDDAKQNFLPLIDDLIGAVDW
ncbi:MAG: STAS domain-containing protein [Pseudobutyrivibrio ruminis]|jgi:uncharacterized protein (TIGR02172 family)|nr:STAS domain-containing protein [Pseudobutyrivibrio ruminis]MBO6130066.1 phosphotransferase [Pseudobutyrivibrio sp.]